MNQLQPLIDTVVSSLINQVARDTGKGDLAHGLLAGLRRIRGLAGLQAGHGAACAIDDGIHEQILVRAMENFGVPPVALPPPGMAAVRAAAILEDVAVSCLVLDGYFSGNTALKLAAQAMTRRLLETMGGAPDWSEIRKTVRGHEVEAEDAGSEDRWASLALH